MEHVLNPSHFISPVLTQLLCLASPPQPASLHLPLLLSTMAGRALRPTPLTTGDLSPWQLTLIDKLSQLHSECFEKRTALTKTIQEFPALQGLQHWMRSLT